MKSQKSWRTNLLGIIGTIVLITCFIFVAIDKATLPEIGLVLGATSAFLGTIHQFIGKDASASHTFTSRTLDPDKEEYPDEKF